MENIADGFNFSKYNEYLNLGMYEELMSKVIKEASEAGVDEPIKKQKYLNNFFKNIFSTEIYKEIEQSGNANLFYAVVFERIYKDENLKIINSQIGRLLDTEIASQLFSSLISGGGIDVAELLLPYVSKDAKHYSALFAELAEDGAEDEYKYLIDNLNNIHFDNDKLLLLTLDMNPNFSNYLINNYKFDVNKVPTLNGQYDPNIMSFLHSTLLERKHGHLRNVLSNHFDQVNFQPMEISGYGKMGFVQFVLKQEPTYEQLKIVLSPEYHTKITSENIKDVLYYVMQEDRIEEFAATDLFNDIFSHPNFDANIVAPNQKYFYYEMVHLLSHSLTIREANREERSKVARKNVKDIMPSILKVFYSYLENARPSDMPMASIYHPLGALVIASNHLINERVESKEFNDAVIMVAKKFPHLINTPNPNGKNCLDIAVKGSDIYNILEEMGAKKKPSLFSKILFSNNEIKSLPETIKYSVFVEPIKRKSYVGGASFRELVLEMKANKEELWKELNSSTTVNIHPSIYAIYNEIYVGAIGVLDYMDKNKDVSFNSYEEVSFITNDINGYIKEAVSSYKKVVEAANRSNDKEKMIESEKVVRQSCLKQLNEINDNLNIIAEKINEYVTDYGITKMKINGRVVSNRVGRLNGNGGEQFNDLERKIQLRGEIESNKQLLKELDNKEYKETSPLESSLSHIENGERIKVGLGGTEEVPKRKKLGM